MNRVSSYDRRTATLTTLLILSWPTLVAVLHVLKADHYQPAEQAMSELAVGPYGNLMTVAFTLLGLGILVLAAGLRRQFPGALAGPLLLTLVGAFVMLSAVFETNGQGVPATTASRIHEGVGVAAFVLVTVAMFVFAWRFRRDPSWRSFALPTLMWAIVTAAAFLAFPLLEEKAFGIAQRLFVATWLSWLVAVALRLRAQTSMPGADRAPIRSAGSAQA